MKKLKAILFISLSVLAAIVAAFVIVYSRTVAERASFPQNGYILALDEAGEAPATRVDMKAKTAYRSVYPNKYEFTASSGRKCSVIQQSFTHYEDGSMAALTTGVIADLGGMEGGLVDCYTIMADTVMQKDGESYAPLGNAEALSVTRFIWKLSDERCMICAPEIVFTLPDETTRTFSDYAELTFIGGGALAVAGAEETFRTVSAGLSADLGGGIVFTAADMMFTGAGTGELCIANISADDENNALMESVARVPIYNIIGEDGTNGAAGADGEGGDEGDLGAVGDAGENGLAGLAGSSGASGSDGVAGAMGKGGNTAGEERVAIYMPHVTLTQLNITSTSLGGILKVLNDDSLLPRDGQIKLYNSRKGTLVESVSAALYSQGSSGVAFRFDELEPDTEYRLVVSADYSVNVDDTPVTGTADLLNRPLYTDTAGIIPVLVSTQGDSICVGVEREQWCIVTNAWLRLKDAQGETLAEESVDLSGLQPYTTFEALTPDTAYTIELLTSFREGAGIAEAKASANIIECKTLKTVPEGIGEPVVVVRDSGFFEVCLDGRLSDPHGGVMNYIYEVCDLNGVVWKTVINDNSMPVAVYTDELYVRVGTTYRIRAKVEFYDNEKIVTYDAGVSDEFVLYGDLVPKVSFEPYEITATRISGTVVIDVANVTPIVNDSYPIMIITEAPGYYYYTQNVNSAINNAGKIRIAISMEIGLKPETSYRFTVNGYADIYGSGEAIKSEWGSFVVSTKSRE